ncbi:MAG: (2Fe-2S)-binding protein [Lachnospiraceae bacterium]|nr:(2Fe-2S)-binding protein [Lachnospiraceae bacterium]MBQ6354029.1 (2Fe-2S)-binding protein [Lachnospiraceae bacterium]
MMITINGHECECEKGEFLLQVAKRNGIEIPTLCHHEAIEGQGCCRLCIVEVIERGRGKIVVSCVYPIEHECEVLTDSEKVVRQRRMILNLLRARAPESSEIEELCEKYGAEKIDRFVRINESKCVLCGLCVKACNELSVGAISTAMRGIDKEVMPPYREPSEVCVGCGSCAAICPTNVIEITETDTTRTIWGRTFDLVHCSRCGRVIGTPEEIAYAAEKSGEETATLCPECRKHELSVTMAQVYGRE